MLTGLLGAFAILHALVLAVLRRDLSRRPLRRGVAVLSFRRRRRRQRRVSGPRRVSWVMAGGVFAGVLGPQLVQWTMDIWPPYLFAFSFVVQAVVALVAMAVLVGGRRAEPAPADLHGGRPLLEIVRQPRFIAAALCGVIAYPMMNLVMTSAPLAMKMCGLTRQRFQFRHPVAHRRDVRAELLHGLADRAVRRAARSLRLGLLLEAAAARSDSPASPRCISGPR